MSTGEQQADPALAYRWILTGVLLLGRAPVPLLHSVTLSVKLTLITFLLLAEHLSQRWANTWSDTAVGTLTAPTPTRQAIMVTRISTTMLHLSLVLLA